MIERRKKMFIFISQHFCEFRIALSQLNFIHSLQFIFCPLNELPYRSEWNSKKRMPAKKNLGQSLTRLKESHKRKTWRGTEKMNKKNKLFRFNLFFFLFICWNSFFFKFTVNFFRFPFSFFFFLRKYISSSSLFLF